MFHFLKCFHVRTWQLWGIGGNYNSCFRYGSSILQYIMWKINNVLGNKKKDSVVFGCRKRKQAPIMPLIFIISLHQFPTYKIVSHNTWFSNKRNLAAANSRFSPYGITSWVQWSSCPINDGVEISYEVETDNFRSSASL